MPVKPWPWADTWPVARLSMPDRGIDLIVLADASGRSMAFGPGLVAGTAPPGTPGNTVLSGHRDTQFRFLRSLGAGDRLRLEDARGAWHDYAVSDALIVDAEAVEILWDTGDSLLTLVTCYPFDALVPGGPLRYVVRAAALPVARTANSAGATRAQQLAQETEQPPGQRWPGPRLLVPRSADSEPGAQANQDARQRPDEAREFMRRASPRGRPPRVGGGPSSLSGIGMHTSVSFSTRRVPSDPTD